jgi:hypothetical protein
MIGIAINSSLDLRVTLNTLLDQVLSQLRVDAADILLSTGDVQFLELAAQRGLYQTAPQQMRLLSDWGAPGRAVMRNEIVHIPDLRRSSSGVPQWVLQHGFVGYYAVPLLAKGKSRGVLELFHRSPLQPDEEWTTFLHTLAGDAAMAIESASLFEELERTNSRLVLAYDATIEGWSRAMDLRDRETEGHSQRVAELTVRLAEGGLMTEDALEHVRRGALLHDIGKIAVPDTILLKPGPLTDDEWVIMRKHPQNAYDLLSPIEFLRPALDIPLYHHEKWDGSGYPMRLAGEQIPVSARIFSVVDVWDALRSDRPYRAAWPKERVLDHIREQSGKHFDPEIVDLFLNVVESQP